MRQMGTVLTLPQALQARAKLRDANETLVFTNGHFDLVHVGHLDYLEKARSLGGALFVGINGDGATEALKGNGRPLVPASERARLVAALCCVDAAIIFESLTANDLIAALKPEIYVKGADYRDRRLPERSVVEGYGGQVHLIELLAGHSTSTMIARIRALPEPKA
ncbi:MAG TPA: adenylyltransferase/cytidyltransferase family protein [Aggregatilineales bacterium]|nr:adenylyltransferase/cytidyltransferase family protein [Aggregatilineales bacterium]